MIENWRTKKPGDKLLWTWDDFDGKGSMEVVVTECYDDHLIAEHDDMHIWIDDDISPNCFEIPEPETKIKSLWDGDTMSYLVYINGKHTTSHWTYEEAKQEIDQYKYNKEKAYG